MRATIHLSTISLIMLAGCDRVAPEPPPEQAKIESLPAPEEEAEPAGKLDRSHKGKAAPAVSFEDPAGESVTLADFAGRPLLLNLWATWCAPCVTEMPMLDRLAARERGKLTVLTVSQDLNGAAKVDAFFAKNRFEFLEPYIDPEMALLDAFKVDTLPASIYFDAEGKEVWRMTGVEDWTGARAAALFEEASKRP